MATSEYIRKNALSEAPQPQPGLPFADPSRRVAGAPFASTFIVMLGDAVIVALAFALALFLHARLISDSTQHVPGLSQLLVSLVFFGCFLLTLLITSQHSGIYRPLLITSGIHEQRLTVQAILSAGLLLCGTLYMTRWNIASRGLMLLVVCTTVVMLCTWRAGIRLSRYHLYKNGVDTRNVVVIGTNYLSRALGEHLVANYRLGYKFLGYIAPPGSDESHPAAPQFLGEMDRLRLLTRQHFIDEVIIAQAFPTDQVVHLVEDARELGIDIRTISGLYQDLTLRAPIEYLGVYPVTSLHRSESKIIALFFKRVLDVLFAVAALITVLPLLALIAIAVCIESKGPALYVSERIGKRGRVFPCFKFRTMVKDAEKRKKALAALNERDGILFKISNDPRVTRVGRFLRRYSLDELPQLLNVLRGEMSLVGPRPPIASEVEQYQLEHFRRLEVMPGLTGLWQVQARRDRSFARYIELDTAYVENWSFWLDLKILLLTVRVVVSGTGS
jgi:exopolysaccharide biosynthesis polyprenyl glycosylphosphotransferase